MTRFALSKIRHLRTFLHHKKNTWDLNCSRVLRQRPSRYDTRHYLVASPPPLSASRGSTPSPFLPATTVYIYSASKKIYYDRSFFLRQYHSYRPHAHNVLCCSRRGAPPPQKKNKRWPATAVAHVPPHTCGVNARQRADALWAKMTRPLGALFFFFAISPRLLLTPRF